MGYIKAHWRGDLSLAQSYWVNGFILTIVCGIVLTLFDSLLFTADVLPLRLAVVASLALVLATCIVTVWQFVGIWRSASATSAKTGRSLWPTVAKLMVILGTFVASSNVYLTSSDLIGFLTALNNPELANYRLETIDETELVLTGAINDRSTREAISTLSDSKIGIFRINSQGGLTDSAGILARFIRDREIVVVAERRCISACVLVLAASPYSAIYPEAQIIFHRPGAVVKLQSPDLLVEAASSLRSYIDSFREMGVAEWAIHQMTVQEYWAPTLREQIDMGLLEYVYDIESAEFVLADHYCIQHVEECGE